MSGSSLVLAFLVLFVSTRRAVLIHYPWFAFMKILGNSLLMGFCLLWARPYIQDIQSLLLAVLGGIGLYFALSYLNKAFVGEDRRFIVDSVGIKGWSF